MIFEQWAAEWGISPAAVSDLRRRLLRQSPDRPQFAVVDNPNRLESPASDDVRLEASEQGLRLWRNNVGACHSNTGSYIRYGLANDSAKINKRIKSSDLIGIRPLVITQEMVGSTVGQFVAREMKRPGWSFSGTDRELAQLRFLELVAAMGGDACFATGRGTL